MKKQRSFFLILIIFFSICKTFSQQITEIPVKLSRLPKIENLNSRDVLFVQYSMDVEKAYAELAKNKTVQQIFYVYKAKPSDTLFSISARCLIPYETIATINSISDPQKNLSNELLVLPVVKGLFIAATPKLPFEHLLAIKNDISLLDDQKLMCYIIKGRKFYFFQKEQFSPTERAFFLDSTMRLPVEHSVVSSSFGRRISPISGNWHFHNGIDLAAKEGEVVLACRSAIVKSCIRNDKTYGNFIILDHGGGTTSVYAHLSGILVKEGQTVSGGQIIGKVGHTGMATGPHLHFELRQNNIPADPQKLINK